MVTEPEQTPVPHNPADYQFDEKSGLYGFFRRHQRKLLYTVVLFTLLTFSVGGPMTAAVNELFARPQALATIEVGGKRVSMQAEDYVIGQAVARARGALSAVLPMLDAGEGGLNDVADVYAMLRRVAITEGIDASMTEVDKAIAAVREQGKVNSDVQVAMMSGFRSLAEYRELMREAMRIGQLVQLETLVLDDSEAAVLQEVLTDKEKIAFRVALFDEKALEERLKQAGSLTEADLRGWLDKQQEADKNRIGIYDANRVEIKIGAVVQAEFDAAQWQDEALKDWTAGEEQQKKLYDMEKDQRFRLPEQDAHKPFDDETVKAEVLRLLQIDQVLTHLLGKLREKQNESMKAQNDELRQANEEWVASRNALNEAERAVETLKAESAASPEDAELKAKLAQAEEAKRLAAEVPPAKEAARKAAEEAVKVARAAFDFQAEFIKLTEGKAGFVTKATSGLRTAEELADLDAEGLALGFGKWPLSAYATYLQNRGDLCFQPARTAKATMLFQVSDVEIRPIKPWDKLKPLLEGAYYAEQAKQQGEAKKLAMEAKLLELAKARMAEKVAEIEGKRAEQVQKKFSDWEQQTSADLQKAEKVLSEVPPDTQAAAAWTLKRNTLRDQLERKTDKQQSIDAEVAKKIEEEIGEAAKAHHAEVLAAAAESAEFTVRELGPYSRELSSRPRFDKQFDPTEVFLWQNHSSMKAGESTGMVQDMTNRRWLVAACTAVEPLAPQDVERREFETLRRGYYFKSYAGLRSMMAFQQTWTKKALETRYKYQPSVGQQKVDQPVGEK
jgi:hypothetical protein